MPASFPISLLYEDAPAGAKVNPYKVPNAKDLQQLARKVAQGEKLQGAVDIVFCSDEKVRELNKAYRKLDKVTDVLSFEWHEDDFAGEIYIATPQTQRQAPRYNNDYPNELRRVVVHGMLHLCGYDHLKAGERTIMRAKEDAYLGVVAETKVETKAKAMVKASRRASVARGQESSARGKAGAVPPSPAKPKTAKTTKNTRKSRAL